MAMKLEVDKYPSFKATTALSATGLCVKLSRVGVVTKTNPGDAPFGVALKATEDPFNPGTYVANQYVPVACYGIVELQLYTGNKTITAGDRLETASKGMVDKFVSFAGATPSVAEAKKIVGIALEDVASSTGGTIKALLDIDHRWG
ncbi:MAG: hypothetical protein DRN81_05680 [Thermoproteota archaeon]|nr:MAG: hypothetical protein DRN81_05680 [Candidatus Korarchaeota archaeon]